MTRVTLGGKIIKLRKQGKTYSEIQGSFKKAVPKSAISHWCKNIRLSKKQKERIGKIILDNVKISQKAAVAANRLKREKYLNGLEKRNLYLLKKLNKDTQKIALAMLYLGEGAKWENHRALLLGSSSPDIIKLYLKLLRNCYQIDNDKLRCRISYRADQDINELQRFWSKLTGIPVWHFFKTKPDPRTVGKKTKKKYYKGVCVIHYGSTEIQLELEIIAKLIMEGL